MEDTVTARGHTRPVGVLESLGDALSAAFDEEMAMWREVAQSYCRPLPVDPLRRATRDEVCELHEDSCSDTTSQSDGVVAPCPGESVRVGGGRTDSLAEKWAEVEELLATIRPTYQEQHGVRRADQVTRLRRETQVVTRQPLAKRCGSSRLQEDVEDREQTLELCRCMLKAWAALALARRKSREKKQIAERHWRRSKCSSSFSRWHRLCVRRHFLQGASEEVALLVEKRQLSMALRHWWTVRRWSRGERLLKAWRNERRKRQSVSCWLEIVEMSRSLERLRRNALARHTQDAWWRWNQFVEQQKSKQSLCQLEKNFRLRRYFQFFLSGIRVSRMQRLKLALASDHHKWRICRGVLQGWLDYNTRQRREKMAVEWWTHCRLSSTFEAWNLLHRCFVYRNRQNERARARYSNYLLRRSVLAWRRLVLQRRRQRVGLAQLIVRRLQRACLQKLQDAVAAERALCHELQQWKLRRRIQRWRIQAHHRVVISGRQQQVEAMNRVRLLHSLAWRFWCDAYETRLRVKKLIALVDQNALRAWWQRWRDFGTIVKARRAIVQIVDIERSRRQQRRVLRRWRRFRALQIELAAAISTSTRHYSIVTLKTTLHRWKTWLCAKQDSRAKIADAHRLFLRHCFRRWRTRAQSQSTANGERVDIITRRHSSLVTRTWFAVWRCNSKRRAFGRAARMFALWQQFVMRAIQHRQARQLGKSIRLRESFRRWAALRAKNISTRDLSQCLETSARNTLLFKALVSVWRTKTIRFSDARTKIRRVGAIKAIQNAFQRWQKRVAANKGLLRATQWHIRSTRRKVLRALYRFTIGRPRELARIRQIRLERLLFDAWLKETALLRRIRLATLHLNEWREKKAFDKLLARCKQRQCRDEWTKIVQSFRQRRLQRVVFDAWQRFTASRLTCHEAYEQIRFSARQRSFKSWQRALARQLFVIELESQFDHAFLRQAWTGLRDAIQLKQEARREWLVRLSSILTRKSLQRWRQLVEEQNVRLLVVSSRASRVQQRLVQQVFDEWTHFTSIRAFVAVRHRREARALKTTSLRHWKLYALLRYGEHRREQQVKSKVITAMRSHAIVCEASRDVQYSSHLSALVRAWKAWRLEFWIKQSQKTTSPGLLRRCFDVWRSRILPVPRGSRGQEALQESKPSLSKPNIRNSSTQMTAFAEATLLQHIVSRQRLKMQRVVHAWALVAQTNKRQRIKEESKRSMVRRISKDSKRKDEAENDENMDPNTGRTRMDAPMVSYEEDEEESELLTLEHWSSQLLQTAFDDWRNHCHQ